MVSTTLKPKSIKNAACTLGENPLWNRKLQRLFWADIAGGRIFSYSPDFNDIRTEIEIKNQIGAFAFSAGGALVLCTEGEVLEVPFSCGRFDPSHIKKVFAVPYIAGERFNDAICGPRGRLISGSKRKNNTEGVLYSFCKGRSPVKLKEHLGISNGMAFTDGGRRFYHVDSAVKEISAYDYDVQSGAISNGKIFFRMPPDSGEPDGMTADSEGHLWVACWNGGAVLRLSPGGEVEEKIDVPAKQVSSVCFGGRDFSTLFITTASMGGDEKGFGKNGEYIGGEIFYAATEYKGICEYEADI